MTIDEYIAQLKKLKSFHNGSYGESIDFAVDSIRKCQRIAKAIDKVEEYIGHAVGGVCPFGVNEGVKIYLDVSLKKHDIIYPAVGSANSAVKLTLSELEEITNFEKWVDVCKEKEEN